MSEPTFLTDFRPSSSGKGIVPYSNEFMFGTDTNGLPYVPKFKGLNSIKEKINTFPSTLSDKVKGITDTMSKITPTLRDSKSTLGSFLNSNKSDIRSLAGLATSQIATNRMQTEVEPRLITNAPFLYTNRAATFSNRNQSNFRNFLNTRTGVPVNATQAFAKTLEADNVVNLGEAERSDANINQFNNRTLQVNASNVDAINKMNLTNNTLKNAQIAQQANNYTQYLQNLDTKDTEKSLMDKDLKAMLYMGMRAENNRADGIVKDIMDRIAKLQGAK